MARMARDYLEVYRRLVHDGLDLMVSGFLLWRHWTFPLEAARRRKFSRAYAPLLGVVPGVQRGTRSTRTASP